VRRFLATYVTILLAGAIIVSDLFLDINLFSVASNLFERIARNHVDALVAGVLIIVVGRSIDVWVAGQRARREAEIQAQRLSVLRATMRTVQDIVNNALNQLQLFRLDAEGLLPEESLTQFDEIIGGTAAKLKALGDLKSTVETVSPLGPSIDREPNSPTG
jgi:hypothetical protein